MNTQINVSGTPQTAGIKCSGLKSGAMGIAAMVAMAVSGASRVEGATIYHDGVSPALTGAFEYGTFLPNHIGPTLQDTFAAPITGAREYLYDVSGPQNPATATPFNLVVYEFSAPKDSVRLYPSQDHYFGGPIGDGLAPEVMEYSVWGSLTGGTNQSDWTLLADPTGWSFPTAGKPEYTFAGASPAAEIFRGGSAEGGLANAYTQDYTFSSSYKFFGIRGSSIAMAAFTADPELDTMVAFNRRDVPVNGGTPGVPDAGSTLLLLTLAMGGLSAAKQKLRK